jgi:Zn-finger nucleic acid-binding protein
MTEAVLFVSPGRGKAAESGFFQSLFKVQPPLAKRLGNALAMAGRSLETVDEALQKKTRDKASGIENKTAQNVMWKVLNGETWEGPFDFNVLLQLSWLTSGSFVYRMGAAGVLMAQEDDILGPELFNTKIQKDHCPRCNASLNETRYEGVRIMTCGSCGGKLIRNKDIQKVLIRNIVPVSDYIRKKAAEWKEFRKRTLRPVINNREIADRLSCPACGEAMNRTLFNYEYAIEIDRCYVCRQTWFDPEELEILQAMVQDQSEKLAQTAG